MQLIDGYRLVHLKSLRFCSQTITCNALYESYKIFSGALCSFNANNVRNNSCDNNMRSDFSPLAAKLFNVHNDVS